MAFSANRYIRQILAARRRHLALDAQYERLLLRLLRSHSEDLADLIRRLRPDVRREARRRLVMELYDNLATRVVDDAQAATRLQYVQIKDILDRVTREAVLDAGVPDRLFMPRPAATQAAAYMSRRQVAQQFKTLDKMVRGSGLAVDDLIAEGFIKGWSPDKLARKIRPYVLGQDRFTREELDDLRKVPRSRRDDVKQLIYRTRRIALTEQGNATHEAQTKNMVEAPMTKATKWRLSPVRGTQTTPDECDILAFFDAYDIGPGVFPVQSIPVRPHPFDRCWLQAVTRPPEEWEQKKPTGKPLHLPTVANTQDILAGLTPLAAARAVEQAKRVIEAASKRRVAAA